MSTNVRPLPGLSSLLPALDAATAVLRFARELAVEAARTGDRVDRLKAYRVAVAAEWVLWPLCASTAKGQRPPPGPIAALERVAYNMWGEAIGLRYDMWRILWRTPGRIHRTHLDRVRRRSLGVWRPANDPAPRAA